MKKLFVAAMVVLLLGVLTPACDCLECQDADCDAHVSEAVTNLAFALSAASPQGTVAPIGATDLLAINVSCASKNACSVYEWHFYFDGDWYPLLTVWLEDANGQKLTVEQPVVLPEVFFTQNYSVPKGNSQIYLVATLWDANIPGQDPWYQPFQPSLIDVDAYSNVTGLPLKGYELLPEFAGAASLVFSLAPDSPDGNVYSGNSVELMKFSLATTAGDMELWELLFTYPFTDIGIYTCFITDESGQQVDIGASIWADWDFMVIDVYLPPLIVDWQGLTLSLNCQIENPYPDPLWLQLQLWGYYWDTGPSGYRVDPDWNTFPLYSNWLYVYQ